MYEVACSCARGRKKQNKTSFKGSWFFLCFIGESVKSLNYTFLDGFLAKAVAEKCVCVSGVFVREWLQELRGLFNSSLPLAHEAKRVGGL